MSRESPSGRAGRSRSTRKARSARTTASSTSGCWRCTSSSPCGVSTISSRSGGASARGLLDDGGTPPLRARVAEPARAPERRALQRPRRAAAPRALAVPPSPPPRGRGQGEGGRGRNDHDRHREARLRALPRGDHHLLRLGRGPDLQEVTDRAPMAHGPAGWVGDSPGVGWSWRPEILLPLSVLLALYGVGWRRLRSQSRLLVPIWRLLSWFAGIGAVGVALLSPVAGLADDLFFVHMVQHLLVIKVAARAVARGLAGPDVDARGVAHIRAHALALASARRLRGGVDPSASARCRAFGVLRGGAPLLVAGDRSRAPSAATGPPRGADRLPGPRELPGGGSRAGLDGRSLGPLPLLRPRAPRARAHRPAGSDLGGHRHVGCRRGHRLRVSAVCDGVGVTHRDG